MRKLIDMGIVIKEGTTRDAKFRLSERARWWTTNPAIRQRVEFDPARIADYHPNETRWLPHEAGARMRRASALASHQLDASTYSREIAERFLIDLSWASSMLEGNTYDLLDTEILIKYGDSASGKEPREAAMILNHKQAISYILDKFSSASIDAVMLTTIHAFLMRDLIEPEKLGRVREQTVDVSGSSYRPSGNRVILQTALAELAWKASQVHDQFEAAFFLLAGISYIQAFYDGNKRVGQLGCNLPLLKAGLPPLSFLDINKRDYAVGLLAFYELADAEILADVVAASYETTTPQYVISTRTHRIPKRVELRERKKIDAAIRRYVDFVVEGNKTDLRNFASELFSDLPSDDREIASESLVAAIENLSPATASLYGIDAATLEAYQTAVDAFKSEP